MAQTVKILGVEYVNSPQTYPDGGRANWDLGSAENPSGNAVSIVRVFSSEVAANKWFESHQGINVATFSLRSLRQYGESIYRRAQRIARQVKMS